MIKYKQVLNVMEKTEVSNKKRYLSKTLIILLFILIILIVSHIIIAQYITIPESASTICKFYTIKSKLEEYANKYSCLPESLNKLDNLSKSDKRDAWGNQINYEIIEPNVVLLTSYGRDKKKGDDKDYFAKLTFKNYGISDKKSISRQKVIVELEPDSWSHPILYKTKITKSRDDD